MVSVNKFKWSFKKELEILDEIKEELELVTYDEDDNTIESNFSRLFYRNISEDVTTYNTGATKLVLIKEEDPNYVLKIPLHGYNPTSPFKRADDINAGTSWDYCENEAIKYKDIKDDAIKEFFAETIWVEDLSDDMIIYAQEKAEPFSRDNSAFTDEDHEKASRIISSHTGTRLSSTWVILAIRYYGFEKVEKLFTFFDENPEYSGDLHGGNVGIAVKDKRPVIFDYSGYRD